MKAAMSAGLMALVLSTAAVAQQAPEIPGPPPGMNFPPPTPNDRLVSPLVTGRDVTFSVYAPDAKAVQLAGEMTWPATPEMKRQEDGVWTVKLVDLAPGSYRYRFKVDGVSLADPRNPAVSSSNTDVQSLVHVDGLAVEDMQDVPHGAIAEIDYRSAVLAMTRRMHVYTPPGYQKGGTQRYPVLYLLHGGGDSDDSWPTIGRAGIILDNLIASGKARPMIVVMPAGHVPGASPREAMGGNPEKDPFVRDFLGAIVPYVEHNFRTATGPANRAVAGLSMGGIQAANIGLTHSDMFRQMAVFSSGWFPDDLKAFEAGQTAGLAAARRNLSLLWFGWGKSDPLVPVNARATVAMFERNGLKPEVHVTEGSHYWGTWRVYLAMLAPRLFK